MLLERFAGVCPLLFERFINGAVCQRREEGLEHAGKVGEVVPVRCAVKHLLEWVLNETLWEAGSWNDVVATMKPQREDELALFGKVANEAVLLADVGDLLLVKVLGLNLIHGLCGHVEREQGRAGG